MIVFLIFVKDSIFNFYSYIVFWHEHLPLVSLLLLFICYLTGCLVLASIS